MYVYTALDYVIEHFPVCERKLYFKVHSYMSVHFNTLIFKILFYVNLITFIKFNFCKERSFIFST